ncbi:MAG TPA: DNA-3-methyladenine glycosylase I [Bacteroidales bacterium]|nr:DNA-3-methyladenine glycosylase I [Bacteroidales bacterium]
MLIRKKVIMTYCEYLKTLSGENLELHKEYHDNHYGFPLYDDDKLFERLMFEVNQAGLSWILILKKQNNFRAAFDNYNVEKVAFYGEKEIETLLSNPGIIRNRLKIKATIQNAKVILELRKEYGSFSNWLIQHSKESPSLEQWTKIFRKTFTFMGSEIVNEFLMSIGLLAGAHSPECPAFDKIQRLKKPITGKI